MQTRIKELRKERKLHQSELAAKINVSQQTVSRIENGDTTLPADILIDLARFFNVSIDYLLYQTDSRRTPDFQVEFNAVLEKNYRLCKLYENLNSKNQDLLLSLAEQLKEINRFARKWGDQNSFLFRSPLILFLLFFSFRLFGSSVLSFLSVPYPSSHLRQTIESWLQIFIRRNIITHLSIMEFLISKHIKISRSGQTE